jgi:endonuclease/exonuclease/phosphatase family metal-dependent hydrolase
MKNILFILLFLVNFASAQVPSLNSAVRLDVAQWNIEWFGDPTNGPSNQTTQLDNATQLISGLDVDLMSLCEISDSTYWKKLLSNLSQYSGTISTWSQTQKTALIYKKDIFKLIYSKHILSQYESDFASGRLPLEVALETTLNGKIDTIYVWVIHFKANIGTTSQKSESYNKRYNSSVYLKNYVNQYFRNKKGLIMGDWNDDFDKSIYNNNTSPFVNWRDDASYLVPTYQLSLKGQRTTASYSDAIDHIAVTPGLKNYWVKDSAFAFYANAYIGSFSSNTSDHFPVFTRFYLNEPNLFVTKIKKAQFFPDYFNQRWHGIEQYFSNKIEVYNSLGQKFFEGYFAEFIPPTNLLFVIKIETQGKIVSSNWIIK